LPIKVKPNLFYARINLILGKEYRMANKEQKSKKEKKKKKQDKPKKK
jgi:hypothetical protein